MQIAELTLHDRIDLIKGWLLNSGIQSGEGGFYAWQDMEDKSHSYLYSEITGYAITALCFLYEITEEELFLQRASSAAQWILRSALDRTGGILTRHYIKNPVEHYSFNRGNIYSFDCAMVAFGMLKLYKITKDDDYLACAEKIISFLNNKMLKPDGLYYPIFDSKSNGPAEEAAKWSNQSGSFHCKLALCLCEMGGIRNDISYNDRARRLIASSVNNFYKKERFVTNASNETSHLHPYCYTLEGILYYAYKAKDESYKNICKKAFGWMTGLQEDNGGFPAQVFGDGRPDIAHQRSDIQAQVLRLSYFIESDIYREGLLSRLLEMQNTLFDYKGGFLFGTDENGMFRKHSNSWCSMFALQTLYLASGKTDKDIVLEYLI